MVSKAESEALVKNIRHQTTHVLTASERTLGALQQYRGIYYIAVYSVYSDIVFLKIWFEKNCRMFSFKT